MSENAQLKSQLKEKAARRLWIASLGLALAVSTGLATRADASLSAAPSHVWFSSTTPNGPSQSATIWISNNSPEPAKNVNVSEHCFDFTVTHNCWFDLNPWGSCTINVRFHPMRPGQFSCYITVTSSSGGWLHLPVDASVRAQATPAGAAIEEPSEDGSPEN